MPAAQLKLVLLPHDLWMKAGRLIFKKSLVLDLMQHGQVMNAVEFSIQKNVSVERRPKEWSS